MQEKISDPAATQARTATCFAGLCDTAVPVRVGEKLVGFLQTGQVALQRPTAAKFDRIAQKIIAWGATVDLRRLEAAYFHSCVLTPKQYAGMVRLLEIFATHLGVVANQLLIQEAAAESPFIRRAKTYIAEHESDGIPLEEIARALHMSTFYFCKMFRKATGLTFTDYLSRVRVERAKTLLLDPHRRVSEIAYETGFGSLTHFNRVFRKLAGCSPSDYRRGLPA
jgi:AraC-like DNA-binding protein